MSLIKNIFDKIYFPSFRYNTFYGNQTFKEIFASLIMLPFPSFMFKKNIEVYEKEFGKRAGTQFNFSYALGRMALYQGLLALEKDDRDEILLPAFTCVVVPNAILYAGYKPCYVDIEKTYFNFNLEELRKKITKKTKAIYLQYTFGHHAMAEAIMKIAREYDLLIIEDCAHVLDQKISIDGQKHLAGSLGIFSFFSTDHSKIITTGVGGMLCSNTPEFAQRIESLNGSVAEMNSWIESRILINILIESLLLNRWFYWIGEFFIAIMMRAKVIFHFNNESIVRFQEVKNYPLRLSGRLAKIGLIQLGQLSKSNEIRGEFVKKLQEILPLDDKTQNLVLLRYSFLVKDRNAFDKKIKKKIILGSWFSTPFQGRDQDYSEIYYAEGSCPTAEYVASHIANFPLHVNMDGNLLLELAKEARLDLL